jgi:hypothetical protein
LECDESRGKLLYITSNEKKNVTVSKAYEEESGESDEDDGYGDDSPYLLRKVEFKHAWDQVYDSNEPLLFCSPNPNVDLSAIHPPQVRIFKLWQVYLENVNPLLKVTHSPTLQPRLLDAASDISHIAPPLEALMFGIYCVSVLSLNQDECLEIFGSGRQEVLKGYRLGAREALLKCGYLRTSDRDCLTALLLYLVRIV